MWIKWVVYVLAKVSHRTATPVLKDVQVGPSSALQEEQRQRGHCEEDSAVEQPSDFSTQRTKASTYALHADSKMTALQFQTVSAYRLFFQRPDLVGN